MFSLSLLVSPCLVCCISYLFGSLSLSPFSLSSSAFLHSVVSNRGKEPIHDGKWVRILSAMERVCRFTNLEHCSGISGISFRSRNNPRSQSYPVWNSPSENGIHVYCSAHTNKRQTDKDNQGWATVEAALQKDFGAAKKAPEPLNLQLRQQAPNLLTKYHFPAKSGFSWSKSFSLCANALQIFWDVIDKTPSCLLSSWLLPFYFRVYLSSFLRLLPFFPLFSSYFQPVCMHHQQIHRIPWI